MAGVIDGVGDEKERLEERDIDAGGLVAATHLHRYELAAALLGGDRVLDLCCGTGYGARALAANAASVVGVDVAPEAIAAAERAVGPEEEGRLRFEEADALAYLRGLGADAFDAVVCFEGIEHVPDPAAVVAELVRLAGAGTRVILSLPNSRGFDERNRFHVTDFGWEEAQQLIAGFDAPVVLEQYLAEGSLIVPAEGRPARAPARIFSEEARDRPAWASHWMVLVGFEDAAAGTAAARLGVAVAPHQNAYMRELERANAELRRANARLARRHLGVHDAAAASIVARFEELERRAEDAEAEMRRWIEIADNNDWGRRQLEAQLALPRYRVMDAVRDRFVRLPGGGLVARVFGAALRRPGGG